MGKYDAILDEEAQGGQRAPLIDQPAPAAKPASPAAPGSRFDAVLDAERDANTQFTRTVVEQALRGNPDQAAESQRLASTSGLPLRVVERNLDEVRRKEAARALDLARMAQESPVLARQLADPAFTTKAVDDVGTLTQVERAVRSITRYAMGADVGGGLAGDIAFGSHALRAGAAGIFRAGAEILAPTLDFLEPVAGIGGNPLRRLAEGFGLIAGGQQLRMQADELPPEAGNIRQGVRSGISSVTSNLALAPLAFAGPGGAAAALAGMVAQQGGLTYQKDRDEGVPVGTAAIHATADMVAEYVGERYFGEFGFLKKLAAGEKLSKLLIYQVTREVPGEIGTTLWQNFNDWALTNPDKTVDQFLREQPDAIAQTIVATLVGGTVQAGAGRAAVKIAEGAMGRQFEVTQALQREQALQQLQALANVSKLAERSPADLAALVNRMGQDEKVRFDGAVLQQAFAQAGLDPQQVLPALNTQDLQDAAASGGEVALPIGDVVVGIKGTPLEQTLLEHARIGEAELSAAEARDAQQVLQQQLQQQIDSTIAQAQDQEAWRQSTEAVRAGIEAQIVATGRYRPAVAEGMSHWAGAFYATMAARTGVTPEQFAAQYPLRVVAEAGQQGPALEQAPPQTGTPAFRTWFGGSKVVDEAGAPRVMYHGTGADIHTFRANQADAIFLTPEPLFAHAYADTGAKWLQSRGREGGANIMPVYVRAEDAFDYENPAHRGDLADALARDGKFTLSATPKTEYTRAELLDALADRENNWAVIEDPAVQAAIRGLGFDGFHVSEGGFKNLAVYDPAQIKSAVGNRGTFDRNDQNILHQGGLTPTEQVVQQWQRALANAAANPQAKAPKMPTPTVLRAMGVKAASLELPATYLRAIREKHADVPAGVFENLPALLADPLFVLPHRDGGWNVVVDVQTAAGEPIVVGVRDDRLRTITPLHNHETQTGQERMAEAVSRAADAGSRIYARNKEALVKTRASAAAAPATIAMHRDSISRASVTTRQTLINRHGADFYQGEQAARGSFNPATLELALSPRADLSTWFHETGHFYLEVLADLAARPDAPAQVVADMQALLQWFGVPDLAAWQAMTLDQQRQFHERFAESIEQYVMEGKAPSAELAPLMRRFRAWMLAAYRSLKQFLAGRPDAEAMPLNADIRRVMDRMLATDEQIAQAEEVAGMLPDEAATGEALERLQARSMRDLRWTVRARDKAIAKLQREARAIEKEVRAQVAAEVAERPEVRAAEALRKAEREHEQSPMSADFNAAAIADAFGFESVEQMHRAIEAFGSKKEAIRRLTEQRMLQEHGDLVDERAIQEAANEAVHNEARARALAAELSAQAEALGQRQDTGEVNAAGARITVNAMAEAARQFGAGIAARTTLQDLRAAIWRHTAAERRAAKRWQEATAAGQTQEAVKAKQDQALNNAAARALVEAKDEAARTLDFFKTVTKGGNEKTVKRGRDPDIVNAARAVLAAYGVNTGTTRAAGEYLDKLRTHDPETWNVIEPMVAAATQAAQPLQALTTEQLQGLHEQVQALWHLAKRTRQLEVDGNLMDIEDAAAELAQRMQELGVPDEAPGEKGAITKQQERVRWLQFAGSLLRRTEQWAEGMDGKFGGPFLRLVFQPVKDAADRYRADRAAYRKKFQALVDAVAPHLQHKLIEAPELGYTFGRGHNGIGMAELLHAILHTGNESNKRKLLLGRKWGALLQDEQTLDSSRWDAFIGRLIRDGVLTREHFDFAQGVWDLLEQTKPLAQQTHRDVFGTYFDEITASPVTNALGTWRGGYVPAQADPLIVDDASLRALVEAENESMAYSFPQTNRGFTKGRVEYNRPLKLDLRTIPQHLDKVLLFSHMEAPVRSVTRLLRQPEVAKPLGRIDPSIYSGMLLPWLNRSARQQVETPTLGDGRISRVLSALRSRAGAALMFANVSNTVQQITGLSSAMLKVRPTLLLRAATQYLGSPRKVSREVAEASPYMAERMHNEIAAMNGEMERILLDPSAYERAQSWSMRHAYFMQSAFDNVIGPIVWTGAYNQALADGMSERDAVRFADGTVRQTQGSTLAEDVSRIETGPAYARVFTQFIGYFNMMANTNATALQQVAREVGLRHGAGRALYVLLFGMLAPVWIAEAIAVAFKGGPDDEDKDGEYLDDWIAAVFGMGTIKGMLAQVPFIAQLGQLVVNQFNDNPADDRFSLSPAVSLLESGARAPFSVYKAIVDDGSAQKAVRDVASLLSVATGLPIAAAARPIGYAAGVADDRIQPTSDADAVRGAITGVASKDSRSR